MPVCKRSIKKEVTYLLSHVSLLSLRCVLPTVSLYRNALGHVEGSGGVAMRPILASKASSSLYKAIDKYGLSLRYGNKSRLPIAYSFAYFPISF